MSKQANRPKAKPGKASEAAELKQQVAELTEDLKRIHADFVNFRRRQEEGREQLVKLARGEVIMRLLPAIDNVERALESVPKTLKDDAWAQGVQRTAKQLISALEPLGVKKLDVVGKDFDPETMDAAEVSGEGEHEVVAEVLQNGFEMDGEVLRHAVVKVRRK